MLGIRKYIFMLARKFGKCIRSTLNSCLGRNLEREKFPKVPNQFQMERWHRFGIFHFWNIVPDNQFLRVEDQLKKKNKTLGTATKRKYCDFITRFLRVQQIKERNIALQSF